MPIHWIFAGVAGAVTAFLFYNSAVQRGVVKGVEKERAAVQATGEKIVRKVEKAQRAAAAKPAPSVLDRWSKD